MKKTTAEMRTRCELAMMGIVVPVHSNDEVQAMTEYIVNVINGNTDNLVDDILKMAINKYHDNKVKYLTTNYVEGEYPCITYLLDSGVDKDDENYYPAPFETDYGTGYPCAFSYVFNLKVDWCSEFGDCFFQKKNGFYYRAF